MKKIYLLLTPMLLFILFTGCGKKNDEVAPVHPSTWTLLGVTYTATATYYNSDSTTLTAEHTATNEYEYIDLDFNKAPVAGTYNIINDLSDVINIGQIGISTFNEQTGLTLYSANGGTAKVTFINNKINVTFSNITMNEIASHNVNTGYTFQTIGLVSANIIE